MSRELQSKQNNTLHFVHITDTHLLNLTEDTVHGLNTYKTLESIFSHIQENYDNIDFLLITGDVSQTGDEPSYKVLKSLLKQLKFPIYCVPGNHDSPGFLQQIIPNCPNDSVNVIQFGKFSLVLLDSCVENNHHGVISQHCLHQLENYLRHNKNKFNILAIHHPPVLINSKWLDDLSLLNKTEFLTLIEKYSQDTIVLFGHIHQEFYQRIGNLHLLSTPSTCYQFTSNTLIMQCTHTPPPAYRYIRLHYANNHENTIHTAVHFIDSNY
ncbi:MAG: hypothetical protein HKN83_04720 [Gammaproteobacteria bacterium]|nr:hypothetical protein [Gammaproteobacteria bacterium]